jgi:DNA polymerase type B, organellar and viral
LSDIHYTGVLPKFKYWNSIDQVAYDQLKLEWKHKMWSFKQESIKYCKLDCETLYQVLTNFSELVYSNFNLNIQKVYTLPSLAMKIYKTHFMPDNTIYQMLGRPEWYFRESYTSTAAAHSCIRMIELRRN